LGSDFYKAALEKQEIILYLSSHVFAAFPENLSKRLASLLIWHLLNVFLVFSKKRRVLVRAAFIC
jgi:hypothetical protein